ncbi:MAG: hypothetical protein A2Y61_00280 [Chloroflexi bacterium RBG_13_60_13]|nr:MAG: hypothetical protein A2Y61_00280 [Chloroflexi bacterium RBG_13_60_13]
MWSRAWKWIVAHKRWLIIPAIVAAVAALVRLRPRGWWGPSPPSPSPGALTPAEGERAREAADTAATDATTEARASAAADLERARDRWGDP